MAGLLERARDRVIGVGKGAGDAVEAVRSTTTGIVTGPLRGAESAIKGQEKGS